jgi:hypothetical protein
MPTQQAAALCLCRLTLSREFASQELTAKAMRHPQCLPALLLPQTFFLTSSVPRALLATLTRPPA